MGSEELSPHDEARVQELFDRLDLDKDGRIDIKDLSNAFHQLGIPQIPGQAQVCKPRGIYFHGTWDRHWKSHNRIDLTGHKTI